MRAKETGLFAKEADMTPIATQWLQENGYTVRPEFIVHSYVDLVGCRLNSERVEQRIQLRQKKAMNETESYLWLNIPQNSSITIKSLLRQHNVMVNLPYTLKNLLSGHFIAETCKGQFRRLSNWYPLHDSIVAVELKLARIGEVLCQAKHNLCFADESYAGLPLDTALRIAQKRTRWSSYFDAGVGLLGVNQDGCTVVIPSQQHPTSPNLQAYCVEKFWRRYDKKR